MTSKKKEPLWSKASLNSTSTKYSTRMRQVIIRDLGLQWKKSHHTPKEAAIKWNFKWANETAEYQWPLNHHEHDLNLLFDPISDGKCLFLAAAIQVGSNGSNHKSLLFWWVTIYFFIHSWLNNNIDCHHHLPSISPAVFFVSMGRDETYGDWIVSIQLLILSSTA